MQDGQQACATILYRKSDISHANSWVLNNLSYQDKCKQILAGFSDSWRYVNAHLSGTCHRKLLMGMFDEESSSSDARGDCCENSNETTTKKTCKMLWAVFGAKVKLKLPNGSGNPNFNGLMHLTRCAFHMAITRIKTWLSGELKFIKQCHIMSLVQLELKSMIKGSGLYVVNGIYFPTQRGMEVINSSESEPLSYVTKV